jgi:hypothetical protein
MAMAELVVHMAVGQHQTCLAILVHVGSLVVETALMGMVLLQMAQQEVELVLDSYATQVGHILTGCYGVQCLQVF